jgi:magnesium transporter
MIVHLIKPELDELIEQKDWTTLKDVINDVPDADVADLLEEIEDEVAIVVFRLLKKSKAASVFAHLSSTKGAKLLDLLTSQQIGDVMSNLEPDERVSLMEELPGHLTERVLTSMNPTDQRQVKKLFGYPEESVGRIMTPRYVRVKKHWTIQHSMEHIRRNGHSVETINVIYIVDENLKLIDDLSLNELILADPEDRIESLMDESFVALSAFEDQEEAVKTMSKYDRVAMPVVDSDGILVGIVTVDDIIDVAEEEATEDMQLMAGMESLDRYYSETSIYRMVKKRVGWLAVLTFGQMLTATAMGAYESVIASAVFLSLFVPMIISSGGNSGSQAATLIIRALSTDDIGLDSWKKVFVREFLTGLALGSVIGLLGFSVIMGWGFLGDRIIDYEMIMSSVVIGISLLCVVLFGNITGSMLPFILQKLGLDPATSSTPFVATVSDVTGILIYFSIAVALLQGVVL